MKKYHKYEIWLYSNTRYSKAKGMKLIELGNEVSSYYGNVSLKNKFLVYEGYTNPSDIFRGLKQVIDNN